MFNDKPYSMKHFPFLIFFLSFSLLGLSQDSAMFNLSGTIQDMEGRPLGGIPVYYISGTDTTLLAETDTNGQYSFNDSVNYIGKEFVFIGAYDRVASDGNRYLNALSELPHANCFGAYLGHPNPKSGFVKDYFMQCYTCGEIEMPTLLFANAGSRLMVNEMVNCKDSLLYAAQLLRENPNLKVELGCHTDARGSNEANLHLSQKRAESAVNYLIETGVDPNRITAMGYGESKPIIPDSVIQQAQTEREQYHQTNRRCSLLAIE